MTQVFKLHPTNLEKWRPSPQFAMHIGPNIQGAISSLWTSLYDLRIGSPEDNKVHHNFVSTKHLPSNINVAFQLRWGFETLMLRREPSFFTTAPYPWGQQHLCFMFLSKWSFSHHYDRYKFVYLEWVWLIMKIGQQYVLY